MRNSGLLKLMCGALLLAPAAAMGQSTTQPDATPRVAPGQGRTGTFHVTFTDQDPRSPLDAQHARHRIEIAEMQRYTLANESFEAYVPKGYNPASAYGIMVMVSAGDRGTMPREWQALMDQRKLIYIGANDSGNPRGVAVRFGLAIDAVFNLRKLYNIDESRVYVTGISGGGKVASMLAVLYPEIFQGSIPIVGVAYFRPIPLADDPARGWAPGYTRPVPATYNLAKEQTRFVLVTGTKDMNRDSVQGTYERGFLKDEFKYVHYVDVPDMGHALPPAEVMDKAIQSLDAPLPELAKGYFGKAQQLDGQKKYDEAARMYQQAANHGAGPLAGEAAAKLALAQKRSNEQQPVARVVEQARQAPDASAGAAAAKGGASDEGAAQSLLSLAGSYERSRMFPQARDRAQRIIEQYPNTQAARDARRLLDRIKSE